MKMLALPGGLGEYDNVMARRHLASNPMAFPPSARREPMLNFNRRDGAPADPKEAGKFALKPALYEPPSGANASNAPASLRNPQPAPAAQRAEPAPQPVAAPAAAPAPVATPSAQPSAESGAVPGSKLHVGVNIKLKGVEISDCDN